ncbi:MAG: transporter [Prevotella sp.]|nr:transporter [Prevotella sp.]
MMKEKLILIILSLCLWHLQAGAQEDVISESLNESTTDTPYTTLNTQQDSLNLLPLTTYGQVRHIGLYPMHLGGFYDWNLHEGLNVSLSASVFAQFGKHARRGAGFTQSLSAMYAVPLTDKLSLSVGGYLYNMNWQNDAYRNAGLTAMLGYRFNDHWEGFVYAQKSLTHNVPMYGVYPTRWPMGGLYCDPFDAAYMGAADRIGAGVRYYFNPSFSIEVSFEHDRMPRKRFGSPDFIHTIPPPKE